MKRTLYTDDHEAFRGTVAAFVEREVAPHLERWEEERIIDRDVWLAAGRQGLLGLAAPEEYGGAGGDYRFRNVILEEFAKVSRHFAGLKLLVAGRHRHPLHRRDRQRRAEAALAPPHGRR